MISQQDICLSSEGLPEDLPRLLTRLFDVSAGAGLAEREMEARVCEIVSDFLTSETISSYIDFNELAHRFKGSQIPDGPSDLDDYIDYLAANVVAHSINTSSPRYVGHMTSALPFFVRPLSKLMTALNQNVVKAETAKALTPYERQALAMIHRLIYKFSSEFYAQHIQQRRSTLGIMVSGGTVANVTALWCARNACLGPAPEFEGVERAGLAAALDHYGYQSAVIIGSSLMHYSLEKAADVLGIGTRNLIKVRADCSSGVDVAALAQAVARCRERRQCILAIVGVAGATESGAIDDLNRLSEIARGAGIHFHVDAAWGGPLLFSRQHRHKLSGIEMADSVTIDGHKQLYLPMGIGMVMLRSPELAGSIEKQARYIVRAGSVDLGKRALEGSRAATALFLHAALHIIGAKGYEALIDEGIRKVRFMADEIGARQEFELLVEPQMNILLYRFIPRPLRDRLVCGTLSEADNQAINLFNERLQKRQRQIGRSFTSRTTIHHTRHGGDMPIVALRAVIANPLTRQADITAVLNEQVEIAAYLSSEI